MTVRIRPAVGSGLAIADLSRQVEGGFADVFEAFRNIRTITATTSAGLDDYTILVNAASGAVTVTLPGAAAALGQKMHIKKIDATGNAVTIEGEGAETIDGAANVSFSAQWTCYTVQSNGTGWFVV